MAGEWQPVPLSELTDSETPITYGVVKPGPEDPDGVLFIRGGDIANGRVVTERLRTITRDVSDQYRRTQLRGGEIVVSLVGNPGQVAIVPDSLNGANIARQVGLVRLRADVDARFVKYFLGSHTGQEALGAHSLGSVQQVINLRDLKAVVVSRPPLSEQRAIAHILGTLDDKIDLNRRMGETLEAMARALFKSWFVDFDPVLAKMEGRWQRGQSLPGLPARLYDLFPDRLVDSELGEIPEGWVVEEFKSLAAIQGGKQLATEDCLPCGTFPVYGANGVMGFTERSTHEGFVIAFGRVGAYCGSVHWTYGGAWINNNASSVVPGRWSEYVLQVMLAADFEGMRTGSAQPFIPNSSLASMLVIRADERILDAFCSITRPLRLKEQATVSESGTLAALRDTLLPMLISGELRVKDASRFVREPVPC